MPFTWVNLINGFASDVSPINSLGQTVAQHDAALVGVERSQTVVLGTVFNSSTTASLQNITGLVMPLAANAKYVFDSLLMYTVLAANDASFGCTTPASTTMLSHPFGMALSGSAPGVDDGPGRFGVSQSASGLIINLGGAGGSNPVGCRWYGTINTGSTAGNFQMQTCPQTAGAAVQVFAGSYIHAIRVA